MRKRTRLCLAAASAVIPASAASALNLLVYQSNTHHGFALAAANQIDAAGTTAATPANFNALLTAGTWDCVLIDCPSSIPGAGGFAPLIAYVNGGGRCVMSFWDWDSPATYPGLQAAFGIASTITDLSLRHAVTSLTALPAGTSSGIFSGVTMPNNTWHNHWADDGDQFNLAPGSTGLAAINGQPVIMRSANGRALAAFTIDEAGDTWLGNGSAIALWRNMVIATGALPPCTADLSVDFTVNGLDLAQLLAQWTGAVTYSPCPPHATADLNQDCSINGLDLASLLAGWGPCP